ncbi:MAG: hypothetical protein ABJ311_07655 [Erythrobacter sp.]
MSRRNHDGAVAELDKLINGSLSLFNQAITEARLMQRRQDNNMVSVNRRVKQTFGGNDANFANVEFAWDVVFSIVKRGTCFEVIVRVNGTMNDQTGSGLVVIPPAEKSAFRTHIQSFWNCATAVVTEGGRQRNYDVLFDLEWVDGGSGKPCYTVNINKLHPNAANRDNMANWLFGNRQACIHEFGHMIGCPDEYNTIAVQGFGHIISDPAVYNGQGWTTNSIMNNPGPKGRIHPRHFALVESELRKITKTDTKIKILKRIGPSETQELRDLMVAGARGRRRAMGYADA